MSLDGLQIVHYEPSQIIDELEQQNLPIVTYEDFTKICRTCLSISELNPISDVVYGQSAISEILQTCIAIQVLFFKSQVLYSIYVKIYADLQICIHFYYLC